MGYFMEGLENETSSQRRIKGSRMKIN